MNKKELARLFARASRRSPARAADEIDTLVRRLLKDLKRPASPPLNHGSTAAAGSPGPHATSAKKVR